MTLLDEIEKMSNPELEALKERSLKQQQAQTIGQAAASVAPGLIGMLVGGTNDFRARQFDKGNQIAEGAGKQFLDNQKNLKEVMLDGQPRYVTGQEALYEQPYVKPTSSDGLGKTYAFKVLKNKKTGETRYGTQSGTDIIDMVTKEPIKNLNDYLNYERNYRRGYNTVTGAPAVFEIDPVTGRESREIITAGIGDVYGGVTKGQAENIETGFKDAQKDAADLKRKNTSYGVAESILANAEKYGPRAMASAIFEIAKDMNKGAGVMTDRDFDRVVGVDSQTFVARLQDAYSKNVTGDLDGYAKSFLRLIRYAKMRNNADLLAIGENLDTGKNKNIKPSDVVPGLKPEKANIKKYNEFKRNIEERIKKDPSMKEKLLSILNKKKVELGITNE